MEVCIYTFTYTDSINVSDIYLIYQDVNKVTDCSKAAFLLVMSQFYLLCSSASAHEPILCSPD